MEKQLKTSTVVTRITKYISPGRQRRSGCLQWKRLYQRTLTTLISLTPKESCDARREDTRISHQTCTAFLFASNTYGKIYEAIAHTSRVAVPHTHPLFSRLSISDCLPFFLSWERRNLATTRRRNKAAFPPLLFTPLEPSADRQSVREEKATNESRLVCQGEGERMGWDGSPFLPANLSHLLLSAPLISSAFSPGLPSSTNFRRRKVRSSSHVLPEREEGEGRAGGKWENGRPRERRGSECVGGRGEGEKEAMVEGERWLPSPNSVCGEGRGREKSPWMSANPSRQTDRSGYKGEECVSVCGV